MIIVTNRGSGTYSGNLVVGDVASVGQIASTSADWTCTHTALPSGNDFLVCRRPDSTLGSGQSVTLLVTVTMPDLRWVERSIAALSIRAATATLPTISPVSFRSRIVRLARSRRCAAVAAAQISRYRLTEGAPRRHQKNIVPTALRR